jgi:hypothetical protein
MIGLVCHAILNGHTPTKAKPHNGALNIVVLLVGMVLQYFCGGFSQIFGAP